MDVISTETAPKAIGPYSQAIVANGFLFTSGQIPLDPATGELVKGDFSAHARRVFENLKAVLRSAGSDFSRVTKATVYLTDLANFQTLNALCGCQRTEPQGLPRPSTFGYNRDLAKTSR